MLRLFRSALVAFLTATPLPTFGQTADTLPGGPTAPRASSGPFTLEFGPTRPEDDPLRTWADATPQFRQHIAWLNAQLILPERVPVVLRSCGDTVNAFYYPATHSITICYGWMADRRDHVRRYLTSPTPAMVTDAVTRSTIAALDHEVGHALVDLLHLPVLGREEDAADEFSAFILLDRGSQDDAYSVLQGALSYGERKSYEESDPADVHSLNKQRYFNMACWLLGSNPDRFAGYAQQAGLPASRQQTCPLEWEKLRSSWLAALGGHLRPVTRPPHVVSTVASRAPVSLVDTTVVIPPDAYWPVAFEVSTAPCRVSLDVTGIAGRNLDLITMLFDKYNYDSWASGAPVYEAQFISGKMRHLTTEVAITRPGAFAVVVSNKFSYVTPKTAHLSINVACPTPHPPTVSAARSRTALQSSLQQNLRRLVTAEELYASDHAGAYLLGSATGPGSGTLTGLQYAPSDGVTITVVSSGTAGYAAQAVDRSTGKRCDIFVGEDATRWSGGAATTQGVPACSP